MIYSGKKFPQWKGDFFSGALALRHLNKLKIQNQKVIHEQRLLSDLGFRFRHVIEDPQGHIYTSTDQGKILKISPLPPPPPNKKRINSKIQENPANDQEKQTTKNVWSQHTIEDLNEIFKIIKENHPGPLDKKNPSFNRQLRKNHKQALRKAKKVTSYEGWFYTLRFFTNSFQDGHVLTKILKEVKKTSVLWPGFIVTRRHNAWFVHFSKKEKEKNIPQKGWKLLSCDRKAPDKLLKRNIIPYFGIKNLESTFIKLAPELFLDYGNPFVSRLKNCLFDTGKARKRIQLQWSKINKDKIKDSLSSAKMSSPKKLDFSLSVKEGLAWITVPTFDFFNSKGPRRIKNLKSIIKQLPSIRDAKIIVFDVRWNSGGNSAWAQDIIESLWGQDFTTPIMDKLYEDVFVEWRISENNINNFIERLQQFKKTNIEARGIHISIIDRYLQLVKEMKTAPKNKLFKRYNQLPLSNKRKQKDLKNPIKSQVFFLTNFSCGSACLDFADRILALPGVIHIGGTTFADTAYMEIAFKELSSGRIVLKYPMKVWRNRPRGHNEPYIPKYRWLGDWQDETGLKNWVRSLANKEKTELM